MKSFLVIVLYLAFGTHFGVENKSLLVEKENLPFAPNVYEVLQGDLDKNGYNDMLVIGSGLYDFDGDQFFAESCVFALNLTDQRGLSPRSTVFSRNISTENQDNPVTGVVVDLDSNSFLDFVFVGQNKDFAGNVIRSVVHVVRDLASHSDQADSTPFLIFEAPSKIKIFADDYNQDGDQDLLAISVEDEPSSHFYFLENLGNDPNSGEWMGFSDLVHELETPVIINPIQGDFDGDGHMDIVSLDVTVLGSAHLSDRSVFNNGIQTTKSYIVVNSDQETGDQLTSLELFAASDGENVSEAEMTYWNWSSSTESWESLKTSRFPLNINATLGDIKATLGDINGDDFLDIVVAAGYYALAFINQGNDTFTQTLLEKTEDIDYYSDGYPTRYAPFVFKPYIMETDNFGFQELYFPRRSWGINSSDTFRVFFLHEDSGKKGLGSLLTTAFSVEEDYRPTGWVRSFWFGLFFPLKAGWHYSEYLGFINIQSAGSHGIFLYHSKLGWTFTNIEQFPYFYSFELDRILFLNLDNTLPDIWFYDFSPDNQGWRNFGQ